MSNLKLLRRNLELVQANPDTHDQSLWRCSSGQCYAGWTPTLVGAEWVSDDVLSAYYEYVRVTPELMGRFPYLEVVSEIPRRALLGEQDQVPPGVLVAHVSDFAQAVLDLTEPDADVLFQATNTLEDLQEQIEALGRGENLWRYAGEEGEG